MLYVLYRWGHIKCFRFDNGIPFGDPKRERFTSAALHLVARGCDVIFNPPRSPTKNAKVERNQGTTGNWADAKNSIDFDTFYKNLNYAVVAQRERLKTRVCNGLTRIEFYPELFSNPRKYNSLDYDKRRVFKKLSKGKWFRTICKRGQVSIFAVRYTAGFKNRGKKIIISLILENNQPYWYCMDEKQNFVTKILAQNIADGSYFQF